MIHGTELLAPARDLACGKIAIDAGADAVYIGAPRFGARARAGNTLDDIAALVAYAHQFWARVYVTVNTLLYDHELGEATNLIEDLYAIDADAAIIQDVGLLECALPPLPLIASTQMHNATPERVKFLEAIGFRRAILARELSLAQIRAIREATTTIELEAFVHGALCVSYSGQCTMSYAVGGRSGNRGECAQPCRRLYNLVDSAGYALVSDRHLLSLRDMNRAQDLGALLDAGITSFKIEGRLKDEAYVANVVTAYRQALDAALADRGLARSASGTSAAPFTPDLDKTFNRGYTGYYLHPGDPSPGAIATPKMVGEPLGAVIAVEAKAFTLDTPTELHSGDGIAFFDVAGVLQGTVVNHATRTRRGVRVTPNGMDGIQVGTRIHRNHDHAFLTQIVRALPERTIAVRFTLQETTAGFALSVVDEDGVTASATLAQEKAVARKPDQAEEAARAQLAKTGGTLYRCESVDLAWSTPYFLPFSTLNDLRRRALDALTEARAGRRPHLGGAILRNAVPYPEPALDFRGNVLNEKARAFYARHGVNMIEPAAESGLDMRGRVVMTTRYCIKRELGWCPHEGRPPRLLEPLFLVDETGHEYRLTFRCDRWPDACGMEITY